MGKVPKLLQRLLSVPSDFTWEELTKILIYFGFTEQKKGKTGGSKRKFSDEKNNLIILHKPHPGNIVKKYAIKLVIAELKEKGYIKND